MHRMHQSVLTEYATEHYEEVKIDCAIPALEHDRLWPKQPHTIHSQRIHLTPTPESS